MKKTIKAFTLIELLISIVLFILIVGFFYSSLDHTKNGNKFLQNKLIQAEENSFYKDILFEDILEASNIEIKSDKNGNSILYVTTTNSYHDIGFNNIVYLVSDNENLIRIESLKAIKENSFNTLEYTKDYFIDRVLTDIEKFKVVKSTDNTRHYLIALQQKKGKISFFNVKSFRD